DSRSPTCTPRRKTEIRSEILNTWSRLWLTTKIAKFRARNDWIIDSTLAVSATPRAAVGSSINTSLFAQCVARAMAMPCRCPPESPLHQRFCRRHAHVQLAYLPLGLTDHPLAVEL